MAAAAAPDARSATLAELDAAGLPEHTLYDRFNALLCFPRPDGARHDSGYRLFTLFGERNSQVVAKIGDGTQDFLGTIGALSGVGVGFTAGGATRVRAMGTMIFQIDPRLSSTVTVNAVKALPSEIRWVEKLPAPAPTPPTPPAPVYPARICPIGELEVAFDLSTDTAILKYGGKITTHDLTECDDKYSTGRSFRVERSPKGSPQGWNLWIFSWEAYVYGHKGHEQQSVGITSYYLAEEFPDIHSEDNPNKTLAGWGYIANPQRGTTQTSEVKANIPPHFTASVVVTGSPFGDWKA